MNKNDFSKGSMFKHMMSLAVPLMVAQLINVLYNVVDRIFIGRMGEIGTYAMSGLGLCLPIITIVMAFANLIGMGGAPLTSIFRGKGDNETAEIILGNSFSLLLIFTIGIMIFGYCFKSPILWAFGADENTFYYANSYISIYLLGTGFVLIGLGLNSFINAQGFGKIGMLTTMIGALLNVVLDPIFIYGFSMGVRGAALATVLSQLASAIWTFSFITSSKTILKLKKENMKLKFEYVKRILSLGTSGFCMAVTNSIVTIVCNKTLSYYGGSTYIAIMTVINSIREIVTLPGQKFADAAQPILGFNYGAQKYDRVIEGIKILTIASLIGLAISWLIVNLFPSYIFSIFTDNQEVLEKGIHACKLYFFGIFMMAFQMAGQSTAVGLGKSKQAIFFSIFRKVIIVAPLTVVLPRFIGIDGVFIAEAISNFIGGGACYITMLLTIGKEIYKKSKIE